MLIDGHGKLEDLKNLTRIVWSYVIWGFLFPPFPPNLLSIFLAGGILLQILR